MNNSFFDLRNIRNEFNEILKGNPGLAYCLSGKTSHFLTANKNGLKQMNQFELKLAVKHVQKNEEGKPILNDKGEYIFPSEEVKQAYEKEYLEFFNQRISIR